MDEDLEQEEAPVVVIIKVTLKEVVNFQVAMVQAEIEGVEVEAATVMIVANVVDPQEAERAVPEDIRLLFIVH